MTKNVSLLDKSANVNPWSFAKMGDMHNSLTSNEHFFFKVDDVS